MNNKTQMTKSGSELKFELVRKHIIDRTSLEDLCKNQKFGARQLQKWMRSQGIKTNFSCLTAGENYKKCSSCKAFLNKKEFPTTETRCIKCATNYHKEYRKKHSERIKQKDKKRNLREKRVSSIFKANLKRVHGITPEDRAGMMDKQKGCCAICGNSLINPKFRPGDLHIDHNHATGKIRGLLCSNCNTAIGLLNELEENFRKAIKYLGDYK